MFYIIRRTTVYQRGILCSCVMLKTTVVALTILWETKQSGSAVFSIKSSILICSVCEKRGQSHKNCKTHLSFFFLRFSACSVPFRRRRRHFYNDFLAPSPVRIFYCCCIRYGATKKPLNPRIRTIAGIANRTHDFRVFNAVVISFVFFLFWYFHFSWCFF